MEGWQIDSRPIASRGPGRIIGFSILAIVSGIASTLLLPTTYLLPMPCLLLLALFSVAIWQSAGRIPGALVLVIGTGFAAWLYGWLAGLFVLITQAVPAGITLYCMERSTPFESQAIVDAACAVACSVLAVLMLVMLLGQNLVEQGAQFVTAAMDEILPQTWENVRPMFSAYGIMNYDYNQFSSDFYGTLSLMTVYYEYHLLANMVCGACLSGLLAAAWGNWIRAKQGRMVSGSYQPLAEWRLPANLTYGLLLMLALGFVLSSTGLQGAVKARAIVNALAKLLFCVQAFAALDASARDSGQSKGRRAFRVVLLLIAGAMAGGILNGFGLFGLLAVVGCCVALFGKHGALRSYIDQINQDKNE